MTLINAPEPDKRITGQIVKNLGPGWYLMKDVQKHRHRVAGSGYRVGQTVAAVGNQIVSHSGAEPAPEVFQV